MMTSETFQINKAVDIFAIEMKSMLHELLMKSLNQPVDVDQDRSFLAVINDKILDAWNPDDALEKQEEFINTSLVMFIMWCRNLPFVIDEDSSEEKVACC